MTICFVHNNRAFTSWMEYMAAIFKKNNYEVMIATPNEAAGKDYDIEWHFMGTDFSKKRSNTFLIHDYSSSSMPPLAEARNLIKKRFNVKPDFRLFLNEYVRNKFDFKDDVPWDYRDMGVPASWLSEEQPVAEKKYDFIYVGEHRHRHLLPLLHSFAHGSLKEHSLLIVSKDYYSLRKRLRSYTNIRFTGPLPHSEVKDLLIQSRYGINYIPDVEPFNRQTSTKFLEYASCKLPIVTTSYPWIREFKKKYGGNYLETDFANLSWEEVQAFPYSFPELKSWTWENQLRTGKLFQLLNIKI